MTDLPPLFALRRLADGNLLIFAPIDAVGHWRRETRLTQTFIAQRSQPPRAAARSGTIGGAIET